MLDFLCENWSDVLLILVGLAAFAVYGLQERKKVSEAASLIKLQIDEIQKGISEIGSYIVDGKLNETAFYESQLLYSEDYWNKYKHYFVKKMTTKDFMTISKLYEYASEIQEQQFLMKTLQKNQFFFNQQAISNLETTEITKQLNFNSNFQILNEFKDELLKKVSTDADIKPVRKLTKLLNELVNSYSSNSYSSNIMNKKQQIISVFNSNNGFIPYCPQQIRISIENYIKKYSLLEVEATDGYRKIKRISERKF